MFLTIVIPTYNRNEKLKKVVSILLPQLNNCKLLIVDNCSDIPIAMTLSGVVGVDNSINIVRNNVNIGMCGNILRCFELATTSWIWLLSDDDIPEKDAVKKILGHIKSYPEYLFFNYSSELCMRPKSHHLKGMYDFIENIDSFSNILFMSSGVYNLSKMRHNIRFGYLFSYSMAPHLAILLSSIADSADSAIGLLEEKVVTWSEAEVDSRWSAITFSMRIMTLLELPIDLDEKHFKILEKTINIHCLRTTSAFLQLIQQSKCLNVYYIKHICKQILYRSNRDYLKDFLKIGLIKWILHLGFNILLFLPDIFMQQVYFIFYKIMPLQQQKNKGGIFNRI